MYITQLCVLCAIIYMILFFSLLFIYNSPSLERLPLNTTKISLTKRGGLIIERSLKRGITTSGNKVDKNQNFNTLCYSLDTVMNEPAPIEFAVHMYVMHMHTIKHEWVTLKASLHNSQYD